MKKVILHIENIKSYTQKIKESSPDNLKHTQLLQHISKSLGFNNYQTLKGIADKNRGYLEIPSKYHSSQIISKRIVILDEIKNDMENKLKASINKTQNMDYFYSKSFKLLDITHEALQSFMFLEFDTINIHNQLNTLISFDYIMYYYSLSVITKNQKLKDLIEEFFSYDINKNLQIIEKQVFELIPYICNINEFIDKYKVLIKYSSYLKQVHAYAQQLLFPILSVNNRAKTMLEQTIKRGEGIIFVDGKSEKPYHRTKNLIHIFGKTGAGKTHFIQNMNFNRNDTLIIVPSEIFKNNYKGYKNIFCIEENSYIDLIKELEKEYSIIIFEEMPGYLPMNHLDLISIISDKPNALFIISCQTKIIIENIDISYLEIKRDSTPEINTNLFYDLLDSLAKISIDTGKSEKEVIKAAIEMFKDREEKISTIKRRIKAVENIEKLEKDIIKLNKKINVHKTKIEELAKNL